ncbi:hypothetical protein ACFFKE_33175 [Streptomyces mutabilis]|uniref:hypothetical protein n=1 Tax=Streptomyces mutabilis TaxID=67332 RepID=UPI00177FDA9A|nr:hypothetical protein [Streptomyces mutabilis]GGQ14413.1 hypothetical protein GCM10010279_22340 [Streptomyces mutabilis]
MRRTARALSTAVLASAALGVFAAPAPAEPGVPPPPIGVAEPVAEVSPAGVTPGGTVTVSVTCAPTGGSAPATLDATSPAFDGGTVVLRKVGDEHEATSGPAYRGTARTAAAEDFGSDPEAAGSEDEWTVDGTCPGASGEEGDPWSATMTAPEAPMTVPEEPMTVPEAPLTVPEEPMTAPDEPMAAPEEGGGAVAPPCPQPTAPHAGASSRGTSCATEPACPEPASPHGETSAQRRNCGGTTAEHGVHAGAGGAFTDSVPALVAGGVLIAGACGAAAHRLLRLRLRGDAAH